MYDKIKLPRKQVSELKTKAKFFNFYNFFDRVFVIASNSEGFLKTFNVMYGRFCISEPVQKKSSSSKDIFYFISSDIHQKNNKRFLIRGDEIYQGSNTKIFKAFANMIILRDILADTRNYLLVHACAMSFNNNGVILAGGESKGKTTMALELTRRGFRLLSDEIAAINISDRLIYPFPRSLTLRDNTLKIFNIGGSKKLNSFPLIDGEKSIADIEDIRSEFHLMNKNDIVGLPCRSKYLIFLKNGLKDSGGNKNKNLFLMLSTLTTALRAELKEIDGIERISSKPMDDYSFLKLSIKRNSFVVKEIERLCNKHQSLIIYASDEFAYTNDFNITPALEPIEKSEAMKELIKNLRGQSYMNLVKNKSNESLSLMLIGLADLLSGVKCYNLKIGRLNEMADLVCNLVK